MLLAFTDRKRIGVGICSHLKRGGMEFVGSLGFTEKKMIGVELCSPLKRGVIMVLAVY